jgi:hypothetical protein
MNDDASRRERGRWYGDGLYEIALGCVFLLVAALNVVEVLTPRGPVRLAVTVAGLFVVILGSVAFVRFIVRSGKRRITTPRTGPTGPGAPSSPARQIAITVGALAAVRGLMVLLAPAGLVWVPFLQGLVVGLGLVKSRRDTGVGRFGLIALAAIATGLAVSLAGVSDAVGSAILFAGIGVAYGASGTVTLVTFLRHHDRPGSST